MFVFSTLFYCIFSIPFLEGLDVFNQTDCGKSKSCLRWSNCDFPNCDFAISWKLVSFNSLKYLEIELVGSLQSKTNGYLALGFSLTNQMEDNGVVDCHFEGSASGISAGYNSKHENYKLEDNQIDPEFFVKSQGTLYGVEFNSSTSIFRCRFLRVITPKLNVDRLKNLMSGTRYYLLSAKGNFEKNQIQFHYDKIPSNNLYDLESSVWVNDIIGSNFALVKCHACLMIIGWVLLATNGIIIANFYKGNWPGKTFIGGKIWFQTHRIIQSICVICVSVGFIIIFIKAMGYSFLGTLPNSAHPVLGIISTGLLLVNPIMALFRCQPTDEKRWIFNLSHFLVGISAYLLAIINIAIGIQLPPAGPNLSKISFPWILVIVFLASIIILFLYGEIRNYRIKQSIVSSFVKTTSLNESIAQPEDHQKTAGYEILIISLILSFGFGIVLFALVLAY